jgi:deoxyribodipyrimidine photo-lyase
MLTPKQYSIGTKYNTGLVWFRRDLRAEDHAALHYALTHCERVFCAFVFDREILDELPRADRRVEFIHASITELDTALRGLGGALVVRHAWASDEIPALATQLKVNAVFTNHDYEPQAIARDAAVQSALKTQGVAFHSFKDQAVFERHEVLTLAGGTFGVFTPYKNAWLKKMEPYFLQAYPVAEHRAKLAPPRAGEVIPTLAAMNFSATNLCQLAIPTGASGADKLLADFTERMDNYDETRNFPAIKGVSYLSVHSRFGTVSIRKLAAAASARVANGSPGAVTWLNELIWRDFYFQILANHPRVVGNAFKPEYDRIEWVRDEALFAAWCEGRTGFPLVDAAMAQLNQTGYMHNRLRMVVSSFLMKDLGIDWRWGEAYFAKHLNDFDLSANNGGWQWAASSGCDAQPYFRIFNPVSQSEKFDSEGKFIRRYLPQLAKLSNKDIHAPWLAKPLELQAAGVRLGHDYPLPVVQHDEARAATLARYAVVKKPVA